MKVRVIKRDQLIEANEIALKNNWPRHFKEHNFDEFHEEQDWPILFYAQIRKDRTRVLFEHDNGELYQLDMDNNIFSNLSEREIEDIVLN
jgi:hypothetical protein